MRAIKPLAETEKTVTLRRSDFLALIEEREDAADIAAVRGHLAHEDRVGWEQARRNYLAVDEARRLLEGESPVRVWRQKRGMTQRTLSEAAHVAASYLAEIETRKKPGSVQSLRRIAAALEVTMDELAGSK